MDNTSASDGAFRAAPTRSFPGGQVRLPKLGEQAAAQPRIDVVGTAFRGGATTIVAEEPTATGFTSYFTHESRFEGPDEWTTIVAAHRALVKEFHPDRFVDHPDEVVAQAEVEIKRINLAYGELRKAHAAEEERRNGGDRRAGGR